MREACVLTGFEIPYKITHIRMDDCGEITNSIILSFIDPKSIYRAQVFTIYNLQGRKFITRNSIDRALFVECLISFEYLATYYSVATENDRIISA